MHTQSFFFIKFFSKRFSQYSLVFLYTLLSVAYVYECSCWYSINGMYVFVFLVRARNLNYLELSIWGKRFQKEMKAIATFVCRNLVTVALLQYRRRKLPSIDWVTFLNHNRSNGLSKWLSKLTICIWFDWICAF